MVTYGSVLALLIVGLVAVNAAYGGATEIYSETDAVTVEYNAPVDIPTDRNATEILDNETLEANDGTELVEGTDYEWDQPTKAITFYNTTKTSAGEWVTAEYSYRAHSERANLIRSSMTLLFRILAMVSLLGGALVVARWVGWIPGGGL